MTAVREFPPIFILCSAFHDKPFHPGNAFVFPTMHRNQAAVSSTKKSCAEAAKLATEESDERWRAVLWEHLNKASEESVIAAAKSSKEHDAVLEETQQAFRM